MEIKDEMNDRFNSMDKRIDSMEERINLRFNSMNELIDNMSLRIDSMDNRISNLSGQVIEIKKSLQAQHVENLNCDNFILSSINDLKESIRFINRRIADAELSLNMIQKIRPS